MQTAEGSVEGSPIYKMKVIYKIKEKFTAGNVCVLDDPWDTQGILPEVGVENPTNKGIPPDIPSSPSPHVLVYQVCLAASPAI